MTEAITYRQINRHGFVSPAMMHRANDAYGFAVASAHRSCSDRKTKFSVRVFIMYFGKPKLIPKVRRVVRQLILHSDIDANKISHSRHARKRGRQNIC